MSEEHVGGAADGETGYQEAGVSREQWDDIVWRARRHRARRRAGYAAGAAATVAAVGAIVVAWGAGWGSGQDDQGGVTPASLESGRPTPDGDARMEGVLGVETPALGGSVQTLAVPVGEGLELEIESAGGSLGEGRWRVVPGPTLGLRDEGGELVASTTTWHASEGFEPGPLLENACEPYRAAGIGCAPAPVDDGADGSEVQYALGDEIADTVTLGYRSGWTVMLSESSSGVQQETLAGLELVGDEGGYPILSPDAVGRGVEVLGGGSPSFWISVRYEEEDVRFIATMTDEANTQEEKEEGYLVEGALSVQRVSDGAAPRELSALRVVLGEEE